MWSTRDEVRLSRLEKAVSYLACQVKNGGGGVETDPVFTASPAHSITQTDIDNWNAGGAVPNLQQVTNQGNNTTNPIISTDSIQGSTIEVNSSGFIGGIDSGLLTEGRNYSLPNKSGIFALLSDIPSEVDTLATVTTRNPITTNSITVGGLIVNNLVGDNTYTKIITAKPDGTFGWQDIITYYNTSRLSYYSGRYNNMTTANGLLNMFIGGSSEVKDLTTITGQENTLITYSDGFDLTSGTCNLGIGYQSGSQLTSGFQNVFLGRRAGKAITTGSNNIIIGSNGSVGTDLTFPSALTNYIQILSGTTPTITPANNKLNIGNWIFGDNGNIGIGVAPLEKLDINGNIRARALANAQGDITFTKAVVAKPDGTFGVEDKSSSATIGGVLPSIRIIDYTQDATNYMLRVSYTYGQASPSLPLFEVRIHSAQLLAQNITTTGDPINQSTSSTQNGITINGAVTTILIPKATNTSPIWNNDIAGIMVRLLAVDNGDGGAASTKIVRRVATDMATIGSIRPKQNQLVSGTNIKTINGTSLLGSGDILTNPISTVLVTNSGASLGALNANTTANINLNTNSTWSVSALASKTGAVVADLISSTGSILDTTDKNLNIFRVVIEVSYTSGGADGTLELSVVNPSNIVIDQESETINVDGTGATNQRLSFRFFAVKTSDNASGYTLRIKNGTKALTAYRVVSILRNNNN
jgi:hypothetical protein